MMRQHTYTMRLFQIFFSVETDDLANLVYSGSDVGNGIGYEMNWDQLIPFPEAGKPDQKSHLAIYFIEFLVKHPYLFGVFEADGM